MFLKRERLPMFEIALVTGLRGILPNGVPKTACAVPPFMMKRTWLFCTIDAAAFGVTPAPFLLASVKLINVVGATVPLQTEIVTSMVGLPVQNRAAASPAKIPTAVAGACRLPRNGCAVSKPTKL